MEKCGEGVFEAGLDVIALGFELGDGTAKKLPGMAIRLFKDDAFLQSIQKALAEEGKRLSTQLRDGKDIKNEDGTKVLKAVGKAAGKSSEKFVESQIKKSSDYKALEKGLKTMECRFKESPVGIFIDENKGLMIVLASGIAVGGAVAMYTTRQGDWVASKLVPLASKQLRFKVLGNIQVGGKNLVFKPSERRVEMTTFATAKWKTIKTTLDLQVGFKEDDLAKTKSSGEVVIDISQGVSLTGKGGIGYVKPTSEKERPLVYDLSLGVKLSGTKSNSTLSLEVQGYVKQEPTRQSVGASGDLTYGLRKGYGGTPGVNLKLGVKGGKSRMFVPGGQDKIENSFQTNLGLELTF